MSRLCTIVACPQLNSQPWHGLRIIHWNVDAVCRTRRAIMRAHLLVLTGIVLACATTVIGAQTESKPSSSQASPTPQTVPAAQATPAPQATAASQATPPPQATSTKKAVKAI